MGNHPESPPPCCGKPDHLADQIMAESAEDTNLEEIDMGDLDELDPDAVELPDTEDDLDLPDMEDSPLT